MSLDRTIRAGARLALGVAVLLAPLHAGAAPAHEALVIGSGTYSSLPAIPGCLQSAHAVAAALTAVGFNVVEREDASSGGTDAAIGEFAKRLTAAPGSVAVVYACAYTTAFNDRPFLLPVTANITRPTDVLTQGVLAKSLLDPLVRNGAGAALLALDLVTTPGATGGTAGLDALAQGALPEGLGIIAASQANLSNAPTPLATSMVASLKGTEVQVAPLLATLQQQIGPNRGVTLAALHPPSAPAYLVGAPAPPPLPSAQAVPVPVAPPATAAPTPPPASPQIRLPADEDMSDADRRRMQAALARLGYYAGQVDGIFGPDTRAAIRRYQHELGAPMTGRLTEDQANKLAGG